MNDIILADEILRELSDRSRIHESVLRSELQKIKRRAHKKQPSSNSLRAKKMFPDTSMLNKEEYLLLSAIIAFPEKSDHVLTTLDTDELKDEKIKSIFNKMKSLIPHLHIGALLDKADETEQALITELSLHPGFDLENVDKNIHDCLQLLRYRKLEDKRRLAEQKEDVAILDSLLKEKRRLMKRENT